MKIDWKPFLRWYPALVFMFLLCYGVFSEKIPINGGLGYHASSWAERVAHPEDVLQGKASLYELQHMLPAFLLGMVFKLTHLPASPRNIVAACAALSAICSLLALLFWRSICKTLSIGPAGEVLGACALCLNGMTKNVLFYPTMTYDAAFFALAAGMVRYWLTGGFVGQCVVFVLSQLVNPLAMLTSLPLMMFPVSRDTPPCRPLSWRWAAPLTAAITAAFFVMMLMADINAFRQLNYRKISGNPFAWASIAVALAYCVLAVYPLVRTNPVRCVLQALNRRSLFRLGVAAILLLGVGHALRHLSNGAMNDWSLTQVLRYFLWLPVFDLPGYFLINKLVSFGPICLLAAFRWRAVVEGMASFGAGGIVALGISLLRCLDSEFRHLADIFVLMTPFVVLAWHRDLDAKRLTAFGLASLVFSKFWLPMAKDFPEYYFWGYGSLYSSTTGYLWQAAASLILLAVFWPLFGRSDRRTAAPGIL